MSSPTLSTLEALTEYHFLVTKRAALAALHPFVNTSQVKVMATSSGYPGILFSVPIQASGADIVVTQHGEIGFNSRKSLRRREHRLSTLRLQKLLMLTTIEASLHGSAIAAAVTGATLAGDQPVTSDSRQVTGVGIVWEWWWRCLEHLRHRHRVDIAVATAASCCSG